MLPSIKNPDPNFYTPKAQNGGEFPHNTHFLKCLMSRVDYRLNYSILLILANRFKNTIKVALFTNFVYFPCISDRFLVTRRVA